MENDIDVVIYTDGACLKNPGPGGYAAIIKRGDKEETVSGAFRLTTNNRMELMAVISALNHLGEEEGLSITIYTDSNLIVEAFNKNWIWNWEKQNWKKKEGDRVLNVDLWKKLLALSNRHLIDFVWVKGHSGIKENEICDKIARKLAAESMLLPDINYEEEQALLHSFMPQKIVDTKPISNIYEDFQISNFHIRLQSDEEQKNYILLVKSTNSYLYANFDKIEFNDLSEIMMLIKDKLK